MVALSGESQLQAYMWVRQLNMEVVQFCVGLCDFQWHGLHTQDRGEDDTISMS